MFCRSCGKSLPDVSQFCDGCGLTTIPAGGVGLAAGVGISRQLGENVKARSKDAWAGLKIFALSPVGGLPKSMALFDEHRALGAGLMFAVFYEVAVLLSLYLLGSRLGALFGIGISFGDLTAGQIVKLIVVGFIPFATLVGASALVRVSLRGTGTFAGDVYTSGAAMLPLGIVMLAAALLGAANVEVLAVLLLFAMTYTVLILYSGCSRIACVPEAGAAPAVPIMLLLSAWLTKVFVAAIL